MLGVVINILVAALCAQFSQRPICTVMNARDAATDMILKHPNPTQPIWPEFDVPGRGVTISGRYPKAGGPPSDQTTIVVNLSAGWPLRALTVQTAHNGKWTEPGPHMALFSRPGPRGNYITRELPLTPLWTGFTLNTLIYAFVIWVLMGGPRRLRLFVRRHRHQCPACAYPIGTSPVCTECGTPLPSSQTRSRA